MYPDKEKTDGTREDMSRLKNAGIADGSAVSEDELRQVYEALKTPVKKGFVLHEEGVLYDCPNICRREDGKFIMAYVRFSPDAERAGYETWLAASDDLLHWEPLGKALSQTESGWDSLQKDGSLCLMDTDWEGSHQPERVDGRYWMSYIGGNLPGYEPDPLSIGMAWSKSLAPGTFTCLPEPVLTPADPDVRPFETRTLYKSNVIRDPQERLGAPYVMFYNAKAGQYGIEKIGIAISRSMTKWKRFGRAECLANGIEDRWNIAGDPQVIRIGPLWVMNYFVARDGFAFDTFACSRDLINWSKWEGEPLIKPSEAFDKTFAHKPFLIRHKGIVYHFYCAVGEYGRGIAVAASE